MKIDKTKLNLVFPVERESGPPLYVHSAPISREVFEAYFDLLAQTFAAVAGNSAIAIISAARTAALHLKRIAGADWEIKDPSGNAVAQGVKHGLMPEIYRQTVVIDPIGSHAIVPFGVAIGQRLIDEEDAFEVENALVFFTCASWMLRRNVRNQMLIGAVKMWGADMSSLSPSEYATSLKKSIKAEISDENVIAEAALPRS